MSAGLSKRCRCWHPLLRAALAWAALACFFAPLTAAAAAPPNGAAAAEAGIRHDLKAGRAFVAVLIEQKSKKLLASEAYADWQAYFAPFQQGAQGRFHVHTLPPARGRALLRHLGKRTGNATVFVNARGRALLHPGLVLEPQVYELGTAFIERGEVAPEAASYGMVEISVK